MLDSLRKGAGTWVAKIFIGLLVLSFAVWGIADIFTGYGQRALATVGEVEISPQQYERQLQQQIRRLSVQFGQNISIDQARAFGLDRQVLNDLITNAAVDQQAAELNLGLSDVYIGDEIRSIPAFQGADGKFSMDQYQRTLRNNNSSPQRFEAEQKVSSVRGQLVQTVSGNAFVPRQLQTLLHRYDNNQRVLDYFIIPDSVVGEIATPDEAAQNKFLEGNKSPFTAPEYRKLGMLQLSNEGVRKTIAISDQEIADEYNARIDQFITPGKRHIRRMSFFDPEQAKEAKKELDGGADFMKTAEKFGFKQDGTDLGFVDKAALSDAKVADIAFSLKEGEISDIIAGGLTSVIVQVIKVKPDSKQKNLDEVKDEIRAYLITERIADKVSNMQDQIEDERAGGRSLKDIAEALQLPYSVVEATDRAGKAPDGSNAANLPSAPAPLLAGAFSSDVGVENDPVETGGNALVWYEVLEVKPERLKKLEEVKEDLIKRYKKRETTRKLAKISADALAALKKGKPMAEVAKPYKAEIKQTKPFKRAEEHDEIPAAAVLHAFGLSAGDFGMNSLADDKGRVLFKVAKIIEAKEPGEEQRKQLQNRLATQLSNDVVSQYVAGLRARYGVSINQQALDRLSGVTQ